MPTTANLLLNIPAHGTEINTWDVPMNANYNILDASLGQSSSIAVTNVNITLSGTQYGTGTLIFTGTQTGDIIVTFPALGRVYNVLNLCTGGYTFVIKMRVTAGGATVICAPPGQMVQVFNDTTKLIYTNLPPNIGAYSTIATSVLPRWISQCTVPPFLYCDGSLFSAVTYPILAVMLGGVALPDTRGRFMANLNDGTGRITYPGSGTLTPDGNAITSGGGSQLITQVALPNYTLPDTFAISDPTHFHVETAVNNTAGTGTEPQGIGTSTPAGASTVATQPAATGITITGGVTSGGSGTQIVPPAVIMGITLVRAA